MELRAKELDSFFEQQDESSDEDDLEVSIEGVLSPTLTLLRLPAECAVWVIPVD